MNRTVQCISFALFIVSISVSDSVAQISSLGANELNVDPFIVTHDSLGERGGDCWGFRVAIGEVAKRCGDHDGCTMRLASDIDAGLYRAGTPPVSFVMNSIGTLWSRALGNDAASKEGLNGDGVGDELLVARNSVNDVHCKLVDDNLGTPPNLSLVVCHNTLETVRSAERSCTLRIDD